MKCIKIFDKERTYTDTNKLRPTINHKAIINLTCMFRVDDQAFYPKMISPPFD